MCILPRPEIKNLKACYHGGTNWAELRALGLHPEEILDFSVCANPFPPPPGVRKILDTVAINRYPDSEATELRECLAQKLGVSPDNILTGNGATELIRLVALTFFGCGDSVLILGPTFGEYEVACQIAGAKVLTQWAKAEDNFALRLDETVDLIRQYGPKGIFLCNPNNPSGQYLVRHKVEMILRNAANSLLILDEAYVNFVDKGWSSLDLVPRGNVIILRSMTKDYALAGLRLGYAVASQEIISNLRRVRPPWNVNIIAQKVGVVVLGDNEYLESCQKLVSEAKQFLTGELSSLGLTLVPSLANFFLVRVSNATEFRAALLQQGILVRDCTSFGLPQYVRIAVRSLPECQQLVSVFGRVLAHG